MPIAAGRIQSHDHQYWLNDLKKGANSLQLDPHCFAVAKSFVIYLRDDGVPLASLKLRDAEGPWRPGETTLRKLLESLVARGAATLPSGVALGTAPLDDLIGALEAAAQPSPARQGDPGLRLRVEEFLMLPDNLSGATARLAVVWHANSSTRRGRQGANPDPAAPVSPDTVKARMSELRVFLGTVRRQQGVGAGTELGMFYTGGGSAVYNYHPRYAFHRRLLQDFLDRNVGQGKPSTIEARNNGAMQFFRELEGACFAFDSCPLEGMQDPTNDALIERYRNAGRGEPSAVITFGIIDWLTDPVHGAIRWAAAQQAHRQAPLQMITFPPIAVTALNWPRKVTLADPHRDSAQVYEQQLLSRISQGEKRKPLQVYFAVYVRFLHWLESNVFPADLIGRIADADLDLTVVASGGTVFGDPPGQRAWMRAGGDPRQGGLVLGDLDRFCRLPVPVQESLVNWLSDNSQLKLRTHLRPVVNEALGLNLSGGSLPPNWEPLLQQNRDFLAALRTQSGVPQPAISMVSRWIHCIERNYLTAWPAGGANPNPLSAAMTSPQAFDASLAGAGIRVFPQLSPYLNRDFLRQVWTSLPVASTGEPPLARHRTTLQAFLATLPTDQDKVAARLLLAPWITARSNLSLYPLPSYDLVYFDVRSALTAQAFRAWFANTGGTSASAADWALVDTFYDWYRNPH